MNGLIPPNAVEFERLVIGTCLIDRKGLEVVLRVFKDNAEVLYDPKNKSIYEAITRLNKKNNPIDMMTVIQELKKENVLETTGGDQYIIQLTMGVSSSAHIEYHARVVWEKYLLRKMIETGNMMIRRAYDETVDAFDVLDYTVKETNKIHNYLSGQKPIKTFFDVHQEFIEYVKAESVPGVPMPFSKLQEENQGWQDSDLIIIAARPGMGKTALALEIARHAAKEDYPVHFFSLEMANVQLHKRIVSNELGIDSNRIRKKRFTDKDLELIFNCPDFEHLPLYYDDTVFQWEEIKSRARMLANEKKIRMIIIDYLQLITTKEKMSTYDRVTHVSREMKLLAKELKLPVIALSQLSREVEKRPGKKPQLSDLRESGAIEQDADIIMFPYRPEYYGIETWEEEEEWETSTLGKALLMKAKDRHCGESDLVIGWKPENQKFYDLDKIDVIIESKDLPRYGTNEAF
ncbi:Replicative DNA helicase [Chryseobacterium oranimense G311]|uniref:replicative DNA helicase n=1 Tax=Chryseobacterium oranimense TaxID=421058 RepID=UPI0005338A2B|nr:replicative DNA helicase [Chryseobacterium oranimense]CEJ71293.1 Replicative DNA helicase [Chryseobacterium oranimense G311]DAG72821.1 MAG TPA: DnaB-like replicative helicase [Caudoviricetes sp.]